MHQEAIERYQAYLDVLKEYNIPFDPELAYQGDFKESGGVWCGITRWCWGRGMVRRWICMQGLYQSYRKRFTQFFRPGYVS